MCLELTSQWTITAEAIYMPPPWFHLLVSYFPNSHYNPLNTGSLVHGSLLGDLTVAGKMFRYFSLNKGAKNEVS